ncbi:MAG: TonB-dependent receptor domain-containing protein, partial [Burkholderiales bacterium]
MNAGLLNPFGPQTAAGQAALNAAKIIGRVIDAKGKVDGVDAKVSRNIADLPAGPLAMAVGVEARSEDFQFVLTKNPVTGVSFASGATSSGLEGTVDAGGKRDMYAVFTEFNIPLIKKMLDVQASVRYDHYQLSGDTTNPKVGVRFQPVETLLLRGSANTGFRAPTLYEIFNPQQTTFTSNAYNDPLLCPGGVPAAGGIAGRDCDQQFNSLFGGPVGVGLSPSSLKAETSRTWTIGGVWEPTRNLSFGLDLWDSKVKDTIGTLPEQAIFGDTVKYASRLVRCNAVSAANLANPQIQATCFDAVTGVLQPTVLAYIFVPTENLGEIRTRGMDLGFKWRLPLSGMGTLDFGVNGTYVSKYDYQREKDGVFIKNAGKYSDAGPIMRWQHIATANWNYGPWTTTLANRYKSGYTDENNPDRVAAANLGHKVGAYSVWDLFVSYKGVKNLTLRAGIKNIADKDPPASNQGATFQQGYDPRIADIFGRVYTIQASYKF